MTKLEELIEALYKWIDDAGVPKENQEECVERLLEVIDEQMETLKGP